MRLHSNNEIATMTRERILELLNMVDGCEHTNYSTDELGEILTHNERSRSLWVWHDHSSLVSHGITAVMIGIMYDGRCVWKEGWHLKFYEALNKRELQLELEARGIKEYPGSKNGRLDVLKDVLCGVQSTLSFVVHP